MSLIELKDIVKTYTVGQVEVPVLRGVSLAIEHGELVALTGASGSGKTTLMNILGCLDRPTSGSYRLDSVDVGSLSVDERARLRNRKLGFVFQSFNLLRRTSALANVMMPLGYRDEPLPRSEAEDRAVALLKMVGLADRMKHDPSQLSGGQQQRVAIARALINQPTILFADEPTGNLDSATTGEILRMFQQMNEESKLTIIIVTHESDVAAAAQRTVKMQDGMIVP